MIWTWLAEKIGAPLLKIGGIVLAVLAALAYVRKTGKDAARGEAAEQAVEDANVRADVESRVAREPDPVAELHKHWSRD